MRKLEVNGFYKVFENGTSFVTANFFNPITKEEFSKNIYNYDDDRVRDSVGDYYSIPICEDIKKMYLNHKGIIQVGDLVEIVSGRKFKGESKRVKKEYIYNIAGMYGKTYGEVYYYIFEDNTKVKQEHCKLIKESGRYKLYQVVFANEDKRVEFIVSEYELNEDNITLKIDNECVTYKTTYLESINVIE